MTDITAKELLNMTKRWYCVATKTNQEERAEDNLGQQSYEVYNPAFIEGNTREPIFPGYVFVKFDPEVQSARAINNSFGVSRLLTFGDVLIPMCDEAIGILKRRFSDGLKPCKTISVPLGTTVEIKDGMFAGIKAIFVEPDGPKRSILMIKLLGTTHKVQVNNEMIV